MTTPPTTARPDHLLTEGNHTALVNGNQLHYEVRGTTGPILLAPSPGWGPSVKYMIPLPALERHCTVVYYDTRHSGESSGPEQADQYSLAHFISDIEGMRKYFGAPRVFVAGHSAGGHQALAYATEHSDKLYGIISIDGIAAQDEARAVELLRLVEKRRDHPFYQARPGLVDAALAVFTGQDTTPRSAQEFLDLVGPFYYHFPELAEEYNAKLKINETVYAYSAEMNFQNDNILGDLPCITVPTLLIHGDDDFICDAISAGERMHSLIPSSTLAVIKNAGHLPWVEQPDEFDRVCDEWLTATIAASVH